MITLAAHSVYQIISGALYLTAPKIWRDNYGMV